MTLIYMVYQVNDDELREVVGAFTKEEAIEAMRDHAERTRRMMEPLRQSMTVPALRFVILEVYTF